MFIYKLKKNKKQYKKKNINNLYLINALVNLVIIIIIKKFIKLNNIDKIFKKTIIKN